MIVLTLGERGSDWKTMLIFAIYRYVLPVLNFIEMESVTYTLLCLVSADA